MPYELRNHPGMTVIGLARRALNANEMSGQGVIGPTWERFMKDSVMAVIPAALPNTGIVAAYLEYESDHRGWYTFLLGAAVAPKTLPPEGMISREMPAGRFAVFQAETPQSVPKVWGEIWEAGLDRAFTSDFELHPGPGRPSEIFIRIK